MAEYSIFMQVRVLYFGSLKDVFLRDRAMLELPAGADVGTLLEHLRKQAPGGFWDVLAIAVNHEYALPGHPLADGDEVALLPPVSGGCGNGPAGPNSREQPRTGNVALVREPIDPASLSATLKRGEDGAIVVFDGTVRNNTRGRRTLFLVYESYEVMALAQMRELAQDAARRFDIHGVALVHRLGRLEVGETSVWIGVASAHRPQAFEACRWLIDTLKKSVPIWKKEHFEDGAVWADGEPFPEGLVASPERAGPIP